MKKFLAILVLTFLFNGNANAGVNEPGTGLLGKCEGAFKWEHKKLMKIYLEKDKKINVVLYGSCTSDRYSFGHHKGKNLEKVLKKTYKICMKYAKKFSPGEDCYLYSVNEEVVWKYDKAKESVKTKVKLAKVKAELAEAKAEEERMAQIDKKSGRFFEDQPDANDDYQFHFIYLLSLDGEDTELDISGWLEKRLTTVNNKFEKWSKKNKKSNGIGQKFKFDYRKDGKLDITFVRMNISKKQLDVPDYPNGIIYDYIKRKKGFDNPKKVYASFAGFKSKHGNSDGGEGGVPMMVIYIPAVKTYGQTDMDLVILHELFHTQGASYACGKRDIKGHVKGSDVLAADTVKSSIDSRNDTYYRHDIEGCPDLAKSVFVTPTAEDPWDPFDVFCRQKRGNLIHKDLYSNFRACKANAK